MSFDASFDIGNNRALAVLQNPALKYLGFAFLIAYHYAMWFLPATFAGMELLDNTVTNAWLQNLLAMVVTLVVVVIRLGKSGHLKNYKVLAVVCVLVLSVGTLLLRMCPAVHQYAPLMLTVSSLLGVAEAILWIYWGEFYARNRAQFSIYHFGLTFGVVLLAVLALDFVMPPFMTPWAIALLPIVSTAFLMYLNHVNTNPIILLLPKDVTNGASKPVAILCLVGFIASASVYYIAAIIPWEDLPTNVNSFMLGVMVAAILVIVLALASSAMPSYADIYKLFPFVLVLVIMGFGFYLGMEQLWFTVFLIMLGVSCIFEVLIISYFGTLSTRRYISPVVAFSLAAISTRGGIILGNSLALIFEANAGTTWVETAITATALLLLALTVCALVAMIRQEYRILKLLEAPQTKDEIEQVCDAMGEEFGLSDRELEILKQLAKGRSAASIAKHFVISAHTVNTHIRHIYDKTGIHKRQELLDYINRNGDV